MPRPNPPDLALLDDLATANRTLFNQGVLHAFGHVSVRHDKDPQRVIHGEIYRARRWPSPWARTRWP